MMPQNSLFQLTSNEMVVPRQLFHLVGTEFAWSNSFWQHFFDKAIDTGLPVQNNYCVHKTANSEQKEYLWHEHWENSLPKKERKNKYL